MNRRNGWVSLAAVILAVLFLLPQTAAYAADLNETELEIEEILLDDPASESFPMSLLFPSGGKILELQLHSFQ